MIALMQPYFFPKLSYWQLIHNVDTFVIYDDVQYIKGGWINRNRILWRGDGKLLSLPLKKDSDYLNVVDRRLSDSWGTEKIKLLNRIKSSYSQAPYYDQTFPVLKACIEAPSENLFEFILSTLKLLNAYLRISTKITTSSSIGIDHKLKSQDKVIAICKNLGADTYINAIGGQKLYDKDEFQNQGLKLSFVKSPKLEYKQYENKFVPWLSIADVIMFNKRTDITKYLDSYTLI